MSEHDRYENQVGEGDRGVAYDVIALLIFAVVAFTFLFPVNRIIPLDRRTVAISGATLTYVTRSFLFPHKNSLNIIGMIDFDVLILLSAIMIINHIFVHLKEVKKVVTMIQNQIKANPRRGFWLVSLAAFTISPFLTNDGVCLLMVEIILAAFDGTNESDTNQVSTEVALPGDSSNNKLVKEDALYFLLTLACSSNIGSALTYTGNPQNMIVASVATDVLSPGVFFAVMLIPSTVGWLITTYWIEYKWKQSKLSKVSSCMNMNLMNKRVKCACVSSEVPDEEAATTSPEKQLLGPSYDNTKDIEMDAPLAASDATSRSSSKLTHSNSQASLNVITYIEDDNGVSVGCSSPLGRGKKGKKQVGCILSCVEAPAATVESVSSPVRAESVKDKIVHIISSPVPYFVIVILVAMIIMIFVDVMSISGLVCVTAMLMVMYLVISNHWAGTKLWEEEVHAPLHQSESKDGLDDIIALTNPSFEQRAHALNDFFEELFESIDWNLLLIFLGTFIIVANVDSTGIPRQLWNSIVGKRPFGTAASVIGISVFVLFSSQLLGNVAVIQLARPNIELLDDNSRRYAWAIISFVATVGGNLTITGSAANIIVAEKAVRIDPSSNIDFFKHYRICFWITLLVCAVGAIILSLIICLSSI